VIIYVRDRTRDSTYHWCRECPQYPANITHSSVRRPSEHLCALCAAMERDGTCGDA
jgi:hypothetical protein